MTLPPAVPLTADRKGAHPSFPSISAVQLQGFLLLFCPLRDAVSFKLNSSPSASMHSNLCKGMYRYTYPYPLLYRYMPGISKWSLNLGVILGTTATGKKDSQPMKSLEETPSRRKGIGVLR